VAALNNLQSRFVDTETGNVKFRVTRERTCSFALPKRFDFSIEVRDREYLIEVHGKQHYELSFLGDDVRESDRYKVEWAKAMSIPLLILPWNEVEGLDSDELTARIAKFLDSQ
jgi:hypothetical protein